MINQQWPNQQNEDLYGNNDNGYRVPWLGTDFNDPSSVTDLPEPSFATVGSMVPTEVQAIPFDDTEMPFTCSERMYGYYADPRHNCTVFHVCFPYVSAGGGQGLAHYAFECPKPTIFDQQAFVCNYPDESYPCQDSERLYGLNTKLTSKLKEIANQVFGEAENQDFE